ncbi:MAG: hypothetical protein D6727_10730 [Gammaproteobacteria bacterium]|nr:MAG: hypothetical protein D6727_10730 [Gammaproteobacteria bacterium]
MKKFAVLPVLLLALAACVSTEQIVRVETLDAATSQPKVLLMEPDIRYYILTMGGLLEPNKELSEAAQRNFLAAVRDYAEQHEFDILQLPPAAANDPEVNAYEKLHLAVGQTLADNYFGATQLPTKHGQADWGLGPGISFLRDRYGADYALFATYRDYQASGGRLAFAILAAAAGIAVPSTAEFGFASLVDLDTGEIVWFNKVDIGAGELADAKGARDAVETLFKKLPASQP